jgi:hypothetical protein
MRLSRNLSYGMKPRIYVILRGGLGNQLHQIAAGVKFAEGRGGNLAIFPHIVDTANNVERRGFFREIDLTRLFPGTNIRETNFIEGVLLRFFNLTNFKYISLRLISELNFSAPPFGYVYFLRDWFQSFEFIPSQIDYEALKNMEHSEDKHITLHVRLTDFLTNDSDPLGREYYTNAMLLLNQTLSQKYLRCFSDDIDNALALIPHGYQYEFPEKHGALSASQLLRQLSSSSVLICSKSSLCWWAANSVSASGGVVVSPWHGFTHKDEWLRVSD